MATVLATKKLKQNQRSLLLNAGVSLVEYNAIKIEFVPFEVPSEVKNAIFTSQNAVRSIQNYEFRIQNCFCVGEKTKSLLEKKGQKVIKMTEYASELADYLLKNHKKEQFHFFCGNIRSDEIPSKFKENNIAFEEIEVYKTTLNPKKFERQFDAILFFSPSGVRSYFKANNDISLQGNMLSFPKYVVDKEDPDLQGVVDERDLLVGLTHCICIGTTTASEAKKYTKNVVIANTTTVESVIAKAAKILRT